MRGLAYEYRSSDVTFQCLCPMYVATRMTQYSTTLSNPSLFIPTATTYARHALMTLGWAKETPGYWPHTIQVAVLKVWEGSYKPWKVLESPEIKMLRFPGLESPGKRHRSWKTLEKSWNSKVVVLKILLSGSSIAP